jgi:hypothetical protein
MSFLSAGLDNSTQQCEENGANSQKLKSVTIKI